MGMILYTATGVLGPHFWTERIISSIPIQFNHIPPIVQFLSIGGTVIHNFIKLSNVNFVILIKSLIPMIIPCLFFTLWALVSPTNILKNQPVEFMMTLGFVFAFLVGRVVFARMLTAPINPIKIIAIPSIFGFINAISNQSMFNERLFIIFYLVISVAAYIHLALAVIHVLCNHLNIYCLKINKPKKSNEVKK